MHADCVRAGRHRAIGDTGGSRKRPKYLGAGSPSLPFPSSFLLLPFTSFTLVGGVAQWLAAFVE